MKKIMNKSGFSLVELSIVLVVLGLLTGGVLTGKSLIRAAELRGITTQFNEIQTAVLSFKQKYSALPGDINNATSFWGTMSTGTCPNASGTGKQTCNGNKNGRIDFVGNNGESFLFWQHLANANLLNGTYNGTWGGAFSEDNSLTGTMDGTIWYSNHYGTAPVSSVDYFDGEYGNAITLFDLDGGFLTPAEAWGIDNKIDDGKPANGEVMGKESDGADCHAAPSNSASLKNTAEYNLINESLACTSLFFTNVW